MNWYSVFYWLAIADTIDSVFFTAAIITLIISGISAIGWFVSTNSVAEGTRDDGSLSTNGAEWNVWLKQWKRAFTFFFITCIISTILTVFIPSKKDALLIIAGGAVGNFITTDSSSKAIPSDITKFLHGSLQKEIKELSVEAREEVGMATPKERLLNRAKEMTKEELINYLETDSTILK